MSPIYLEQPRWRDPLPLCFKFTQEEASPGNEWAGGRSNSQQSPLQVPLLSSVFAAVTLVVGVARLGQSTPWTPAKATD